MEHLKIAYYFAVLLVGAAAIVHAALLAGAYRLPFLKPLVWFLGFNNGLALINLTSAYACANLIGFCALGQYTVLAGILGPAARLSQLGIVYALLAVVRGFAGGRLSPRFKQAFGVVVAVVAIGYAVLALLAPGSGPWIWLARAQVVVFVLGILAILGALAFLIARAAKIESGGERRAVRAFGWVYFAIYALFVLTFWLPDAVQFPPNALALLAINVFPLIWFRRPFAAAYAATSAAAMDREGLERFSRTRGLTAREADILELILRGQSNADIEKRLFISIHTVKNHITNLYQKLGVRSRWQLISLFHQGPPARSSGAAAPVEEAEVRPPNGLRPQ